MNGERFLSTRLAQTPAWCWDGTHEDAALLGQWLIAIGAAESGIRVHYRNRNNNRNGVDAYVEITHPGGETQILRAGEWVLWFGTAIMLVDERTRQVMFATEEHP